MQILPTILVVVLFSLLFAFGLGICPLYRQKIGTRIQRFGGFEASAMCDVTSAMLGIHTQEYHEEYP